MLVSTFYISQAEIRTPAGSLMGQAPELQLILTLLFSVGSRESRVLLSTSPMSSSDTLEWGGKK